jgi:Predicted epimerase, PhzC/PhzF homolog
MCGHATLAAGHILMTGSSVHFSTKSGLMTVTRGDELLELDMRAANLAEVREPDLCSALGLPNSAVWLADGYNDAAIIEVADEAAVRAVSPDYAASSVSTEWRSSPLAGRLMTSRAGCSSPISASTRTR